MHGGHHVAQKLMTIGLPKLSDRRIFFPFASSTVKSGAVFGTASMIDGMIDRMEGELGHAATIVATGGLAGGILPYCRHEIRHEPDLLLKGLAILYQKNAKPKKHGK